MLKCLAIICLLGLTVSAFELESGSAGKRSNRMNMLTRHVGARMLAGTNGQDFQMTGNSGFVPIPRQSSAMPSTGVTDNTIGGQQQLTPEQMQQLQSFMSSQQQSIAQQQSLQQQQKPTMNQMFQPTSQQTQQGFRVVDNGFNSFDNQQPQQQQQKPTTNQMFQPTTQSFNGGNNQQQQQQFPSVQPTFNQPQQTQQTFRVVDNGFNSFDNQQPQQQQQQFNQGQGRMSGMGLGTISTTTPMMTTTTTPVMPITSFMIATTTPTTASKPSPTEQQLLDQQIHIQKLKEQLFNMQQQQQQQQQKPQQPSFQTPTTTNTFGTPSQQNQQQQQQQFQQSNQQSQAFQQQQLIQQEQKQQQKISLQQQQQLLDQINQLNQLNQKQQTAQQQPAQNFQTQQQPAQNFQTQQQPTQNFQTQQFSQLQQPITANMSRMVSQVRPMPTQPVQQQQQQQQMFMAPKQQQVGRVGGGSDICVGRGEGELLPHPVDETQFIVCGNLGEITLMDCPNHTVFNPHLKLCDLTSEMPTLCKSNPCLNGAKCVELSPTQFQCECPAGFSGRTCEKFDTCSSAQPCGSDGVCLSFALGSPIPHVCLCNGGRSVGITCQQGEQNPCLLPGSSTKLMGVNFSRAVFAHCEGARPHFKFCQPPLMFSAAKQSCEWSI